MNKIFNEKQGDLGFVYLCNRIVKGFSYKITHDFVYFFSMSDTKYLKTGAFLFLSSFIIGYGGLAVTGFLYFKTENYFWLWSGLGLYLFSWVLFGLGFIVAGKEGLTWLKLRFKKVTH